MKPEKNCLAIMVVMCLIAMGCTRQLPPEEAELQLRAFDGELIKLQRNIRRTASFSALQELASIPGTSLPFLMHQPDEPGMAYRYDFHAKKGVYAHDTTTGRFLLIERADAVVLHFSDPANRNARIEFVLHDFAEAPTSSGFLFPVRINAQMSINDKPAIYVMFQGEVAHGMPVGFLLDMHWDDYRLRAEMSGRLRKTRGEMHLDFHLSRMNQQLIDADINAKIGMDSLSAYYIRDFRCHFALFPIELRARVKAKNIPADTRDFVGDFNRNSNIQVYSAQKRERVGEVKLHRRKDKLDYVVYFSDGSYMYLDDNLLSVMALLGIKLP